MSAPSTTSYVPLDSDAPPVFSATQTTLYLDAAFLMLLLYDHVITLDKEVEWIWTLRWRLPKIVFVFNRYVITLLLLLSCIPDFIFPVSVPFCNFTFNLALYQPLLNFGAAELIIIIRVCSLYGNHELISWSLRGFLVLALIGAIVSQALFGRAWQVALYYELLPGCWGYSSAVTPVSQWHAWISFMSVEGILMLLTAYKLLSYRNDLNRTITVLARDSIAYFVVVFACLAVILATNIRNNTVFFQVPAQCVASVAVGRMMMNIRGLVLDDPEHTVHLQTLQFARQTNSSTEMDELA